jgi:DNA modification methylase
MTYQVLLGDCIEQMRTLPDQSVHTCVTSPPYFRLRDYGSEGQIGQEETPEAFVAKLVEVFREVRRVLRDDGTLWLNLGDSYAGTGKSGGGKQGERWAEAGADTVGPRGGKWKPAPEGMKQKDLIGIPWRVAFALQADGWYLRQDIIWHKPNPMPESVRDRCTKAHEYVFLLSKGPRYYFDAEAIKEESADLEKSAARYKSAFGGAKSEALLASGQVHTRPIGMRDFDGKRNRRSVWTVTTKPYSGAHFATFPPDLIEPCILAGAPVGGTVLEPFGGSGTTAGVAVKHGRKAILCELNPEYAALIPARVKHIAGDTCDLFSR